MPTYIDLITKYSHACVTSSRLLHVNNIRLRQSLLVPVVRTREVSKNLQFRLMERIMKIKIILETEIAEPNDGLINELERLQNATVGMVEMRSEEHTSELQSH